MFAFGYDIVSVLSAIPFSLSPLALLAWVGLSIYRFVSAKKANKRVPDTYSKGAIIKRLVNLIASSTVLIVVILIVIGIGYLLTLPISFM